MELEGFEPSSNQATHKISTCLFCFWFSTGDREQTPNHRLNFCGFRFRIEVFRNLFLHCYAPESNAAEQSVCETSCFLTVLRESANPTVIQIMLQERTLRCQLKVCSKGLKRSRYGSLHAYLSIDLAVETSQPHLFGKSAKISKNYSQPKIIWAYPSIGLLPLASLATLTLFQVGLSAAIFF